MVQDQNALQFDKSLFCGCKSPAKKANARIVNGKDVGENDLSWIVSIFVKAKFNDSSPMKYHSFCTGSGNFGAL